MIEHSNVLSTSSSFNEHDTGKLKVINLWVGPGGGKSTLAAAIFNVMKKERFSVELIPEIAKEMTYEKAMSQLSNQLLVLAKQEHQLRRLIGQVEYVIVDSPFPMGLAYCRPEDVNRYQHLIDCLWDDYDNYDFFINRTAKPFQQFGRNQNFEQAVALDGIIKGLWTEFSDAEFDPIFADDMTAEWKIIDSVLDAQGQKTLAERHNDAVTHAEGRGPNIEFTDLMGAWHQ